MSGNKPKTDGEIQCEVCGGRGVVIKRDRLHELVLIYDSLGEYDQREVLLYAEYLKQRRNKPVL